MSEKGRHHYIGGNHRSILRDGEMYNTRWGMGIHSPNSLHRFEGHSPTRIVHEPLWLPRETGMVAEKLNESGSVLVTGEPGAGKTTVMYGLRKLLREGEIPYCYHDGHFHITKPTQIESGLRWAKKNNGVFIWDSFDYLVATSGKIRRNISRNNAVEKAKSLLTLVNQQMHEGLRVVATAHNSDWLMNFADPILIEDYWKPTLEHMATHEVKGKFESDEELTAFYELVGTQAGFSPDDAAFFGALPSHFTDAEAILNPEGIDVRRELSSYRIAKLVCLDERREQTDLLDRYAAYKRRERSIDDVKTAAARYVRIKHNRTQKMMGNNYDVQLLGST